MSDGYVTLEEFPPVMLAVPTAASMWTDSANAIAELRLHLPPGSVVHQTGAGPSSIAAARNRIARAFHRSAEERGLEYMLWVDSDMLPRPETAVRLLSVARATGAELVSALYFMRVPPFAPVIDGVQNLPPDARGIAEVGGAGFGCMLMHRSLLVRIAEPWFEYPPGHAGFGEDFIFCAKAREAGARIVVDLDHEVGHLAVLPVTRALAAAYAASR